MNWDEQKHPRQQKNRLYQSMKHKGSGKVYLLKSHEGQPLHPFQPELPQQSPLLLPPLLLERKPHGQELSTFRHLLIRIYPLLLRIPLIHRFLLPRRRPRSQLPPSIYHSKYPFLQLSSLPPLTLIFQRLTPKQSSPPIVKGGELTCIRLLMSDATAFALLFSIVPIVYFCIIGLVIYLKDKK